MTVELAKASYPPNAKERKPERKAPPPFRLPQKKTDEEYELWVTMVRKDSPKVHFNFDGVDFAKYWQPARASIKGNDDLRRDTIIPTKFLTESQAEAIREHADKIEFHVPPSPNPNYDRNEEGSKLFSDGYWKRVSECIILERAANFNPLDYQPRPEPPEEPMTDMASELSNEIYEAQKKKKKK